MIAVVTQVACEVETLLHKRARQPADVVGLGIQTLLRICFIDILCYKREKRRLQIVQANNALHSGAFNIFHVSIEG
ncbi:hypothetical protein D3C87_1768300 [compost metagenome]